MGDKWAGYMGRILDVDLTEGTIRLEDLDSEMASAYVGGKGFAARMLYDQLAKGCDPLSPGNLLIFSTGPLTGTLAPGSGRSVVATKSPATGYWLDANCGGFFGPELKMAGFDGVVIRGKARVPVILKIDDKEAEILETPDLWGLDPFTVEKKIRGQLGKEYRLASIGIAGEKGVLFASIISEARAFGRGGAGAVMGSKNLKAVAVRGRQPITVFESKRFMRTCQEASIQSVISRKGYLKALRRSMRTISRHTMSGTGHVTAVRSVAARYRR
jgi:aldehyde:ferredoxin oxidoreductase